MKTIRLISIISRVGLMITLVLGLLSWIAQWFLWGGLLSFLTQIGFPAIHEAGGFIGVLGLCILGIMILFTKGHKRFGVVCILYAVLVPVFGLLQMQILVGNLHWLVELLHMLLGIGAMMLILRNEKLFRQDQERKQGNTAQPLPGKSYSPLLNRLARLATGAHVGLYRLSGGKIAGNAQHMPILLLTTIGRKSGKEHTTPLVYMPDGKNFVVVASNGGQGKLPNWWLNIREKRQAQVEIEKKNLRVGVREAVSEERQLLWSRVIAYKAGHEAYQERTPYPIPLVVLYPEEASE